MSYTAERAEGSPEEIEEIAHFLSSFEGRTKQEQKLPLRIWRKRMRSWWTENPYCRESSPKGFLLRSSSEAISGFLGLIPHDYTFLGSRIPSLALTTHFVKPEARAASLPLFLKAVRLSNQYQLVDGTPNQPAQALLHRTKFTQIPASSVSVYPIVPGAIGNLPSRFFVSASRKPQFDTIDWSDGLVTDLSEVAGLALGKSSDVLEKHIDRDTLDWYLSSGSERKFFAGWRDGEQLLQCFVLGIEKTLFGIPSLLILEASANPTLGKHAASGFIRFLARHRKSADLPPRLRMILYPITQDQTPDGSFLKLKFKRQFPIFHKLPETSNAREARRVVHLSEGDRVFL